MPRFKPGDEVVIRRAEALPVSDSVKKMDAGKRYVGDMGGCKGIVCAPVFEREGYDGPHPGVEKVTIAPTDYSKDGQPTGLVDIPVAQLRHTSMSRRVAGAAEEVRGGLGRLGSMFRRHGRPRARTAGGRA